MDWIQILQGVFIAAISAWLYWQKHKEKRIEKQLGLAENPERCRVHKESVDEVKRRLDEVAAKLGKLETAVAVIKDRLGIGE